MSQQSINDVQKIVPVILCGGLGTRLWPLSREKLPKQFVPLVQNKSLLEITIDRIRSFSNPIFSTAEFYCDDVQTCARRVLGSRNFQVFLAPSVRNTAAVIATAAMLPSINEDDFLLFLPSDHFIPDFQYFEAVIKSALPLARHGYIVTFGVQPSFPSTAYGYIQKGNHIDDVADAGSGLFAKKFIEKPNLSRAGEIILSGDYLWNSGIFLCRANTLLNELRLYAPDIFNSCLEAMKNCSIDNNVIRPMKDLYDQCRAQSIDYAVMEHSKRIALVPFEAAWSDVGSWDQASLLFSADQHGNRVDGNAVVVNSKNTFIYSHERLVAALGVSNLAIIDSKDALLVVSLDNAQDIKNILNEIEANKDLKQVL